MLFLQEAVAMVLTSATEHAVGHAVTVDVVLLTIRTLLDADVDLSQTGVPRVWVWTARQFLSATVAPGSTALTVAATRVSLLHQRQLLPLLHRLLDIGQGQTVAMLLLKADMHMASLAVAMDVIFLAFWTVVDAIARLHQTQSTRLWMGTRPRSSNTACTSRSSA